MRGRDVVHPIIPACYAFFDQETCAMNQMLKEALKEVETLPEEEQEELAQALLRMAVRKKIDAELAASEAEGGEIPHEEVFREFDLRNRG
jgi:hypothetical protein